LPTSLPIDRDRRPNPLSPGLGIDAAELVNKPWALPYDAIIGMTIKEACTILHANCDSLDAIETSLRACLQRVLS
jgi:hypothetical protein